MDHFLTLIKQVAERRRAEEALREERDKAQKYLDVTGVMLVAIGNDQKVRLINKKGCLVLACQEGEIVGKNWFDNFIPERFRDEVKAIFSRLIAGEIEPFEYFENPVLTKDGEERIIAWHNNVLKDEAGNIINVLSSGQDITERKQAEEALRKSEEKYRELADFLPQIVFENDERGNLTFFNRYAFQSLGYTLEDFDKGLNTIQMLIPEERDRASEYIQRVLNEEEPSGIEYMALRKDGSTFPVIIYSTPIIRNNKPVGLRSIMIDITERKQAEEKLKQAAEEWRTTFDSITDLISIHDKDFKLIRVNKAFASVFKKKPAELIGKPCYEMVHGTSEPVPLCPHKVTIKTKKPATAEFFEPHLGIHLEVSTSPIFNEKGEVVACVHITRDITQRKKMEEQLIVTDRLASIGELASGIAHELNNPLTSILGFSDLLLGKDIPDDVKEDLRVINREAQRTAGVVRNLLTFARKHAPEKKPMDINKTIQTVLELRAYEQKVNNIQVNTQFAPDLPEITADGFQLQQIFLNIIINAEHFMTEAHGRGTLTITTERVEDIIRASFIDDGPGIAEENLGYLFDPFFTTKEVGKGTGLGLSICHGIITEHGGRIYTESKLGKGATFVVELPISKQ